MYLTNHLMNWAYWLKDICILRVIDIHWSYQNLLFWAGIVWDRLSANVLNLKKVENYTSYQVDILLPMKLQKISYYFGLCWKILLANQFADFLYFWLVWLVNLNTRGLLLHCTCFFSDNLLGIFFFFTYILVHLNFV